MLFLDRVFLRLAAPLFWVLLILVLFLSLAPARWLDMMGLWGTAESPREAEVWSWVKHAGYYALMLACGLRSEVTRSALRLASALFLLSLVLEAFQAFSEGRTASWEDALANLLGLAIGGAAFWGYRLLCDNLRAAQKVSSS